MDQDRRQPGGAGQPACPRRGALRQAQAGGGLSGGRRAGGRVKGPAQPAMMSGVVVLRRPRPEQPRRFELVPAGDGLAHLLQQRLGFGRYLAGQAGYGHERERGDLRVVPASQQARQRGQPGLSQRPVGGRLPVEPLDPGSGTREQEDPVGVEQDQLVPAGHVQHQPFQVHADQRGEPRCLRRHQQRVDRRSHEVVGHAQSMAPRRARPAALRLASGGRRPVYQRQWVAVKSMAGMRQDRGCCSPGTFRSTALLTWARGRPPRSAVSRPRHAPAGRVFTGRQCHGRDRGDVQRQRR